MPALRQAGENFMANNPDSNREQNSKTKINT